jgi:hypothetical protein
MKYVGGNIFINNILFMLSTNLSCIVAGSLQKMFRTKLTIVISFAMAGMFGIPLIFWPEVTWVIPIAVFGSSFGTAVAFAMVYYINSEIFPPLFVPFAFGAENLIARILTMSAPYLAEVKKPIPMIINVVISGIAIIVTIVILKVPRKVKTTTLSTYNSKSIVQ